MDEELCGEVHSLDQSLGFLIAIIAGVDKIFDMGRTAVNITGDAACALIVSNIERKREERKATKAA